MDTKTKISSAYDKVAGKYLAKYPSFDLQHKKLLDFAISKLKKEAKVLDLGCGPGIPYTKYISERFDTTAVDFSKGQIKLAKRNAPKTKYILSDFKDLQLPERSFDLITAFYSLIHVPIKEQAAIIKKIYQLLKKEGCLLVTMGYKKWEGKEQNWLGSGITMYWSHLGKKENIDMIKDVGFEIVKTAIERDQNSLEGKHLVILAHKP